MATFHIFYYVLLLLYDDKYQKQQLSLLASGYIQNSKHASKLQTELRSRFTIAFKVVVYFMMQKSIMESSILNC